jgi:sigma-E factor negative regulatory protein RseC
MSESVTTTGMLEETGKVVGIEGKYVVIETQQRSSCGHCNVSDNCGTSVLAGLFKRRRNQVRLINHLNLSVGDDVVIGINESVLLSTAALAYMLPLIMMIVLSLVTSFSGYGDDVSFIVGMIGLFSGMQIANTIMGRNMNSDDFQSREIVLLRNANEPRVQFSK